MVDESTKLYRIVWRWHFYAGLFCIPFILSLSITGAIFLFKPQINQWIDKDYQHLEVLNHRYSPNQQIAAAKTPYPDASFSRYRLPEHDQQAIVITLNNGGEEVLVYVNPYTLDILKTMYRDDQFIRIVRSLHGELMLGTTGSIVVELAGCWAIVLIVSGLYLWWSRSPKTLAGTIYPRIFSGGRKFWRDLHAVTGLWVSLFTLFLLISGLPWALVWGSAFKEIRHRMEPSLEQDWRVVNAVSKPAMNDTPSLLSAELLKKAMDLNFASPVELSLDRNAPNKWKVSSGHQNRMLRGDAWFSAEDNGLLTVRDFSQKPVVDKIIGIGISAHEGHLFGWLNQLLGLLVTMGLVAVSVSGFVLWRKRKPTGELGAAPRFKNSQVGKVVLGLTIVLSLLLPVLAISLLCLIMVEKIIVQRVPMARSWLGIAEK